MSAYIGRYHRVRGLTSQGLTAPYVLDRTRHTVQPCADEEWWRHPSGLWYPVLQGGVGFSGQMHSPTVAIGAGIPSNASQVTVALSSAYVAGSTGSAIATKLTPWATRMLNNLYVFVTGYTGTAANVNDLNWEIRTGTAGIPDTTAPGLVASGSVNPSSATGWINISGLSQSLTAGTIYWFIIGDVDGGGTDFATVLRHLSTGFNSDLVSDALRLISTTTTNGFSTITRTSVRCCMVSVFSDGSSIGNPFSQTANATNSDNRKGLRLDGLTETLKTFGWYCAMNANISGIELFSGATGPGGTPETIGTTYPIYQTSGSGTVPAGHEMATPFTLVKSTLYRFVFTYGGNATVPVKISIGTGTDANLRAAMLGNGNWYYAEANETTDWSNDDISSWPNMGIWVEDQIAVAGGGGSGGGPLVGGRLVGS